MEQNEPERNVTRTNWIAKVWTWRASFDGWTHRGYCFGAFEQRCHSHSLRCRKIVNCWAAKRWKSVVTPCSKVVTPCCRKVEKMQTDDWAFPARDCQMGDSLRRPNCRKDASLPAHCQVGLECPNSTFGCPLPRKAYCPMAALRLLVS
jgi:hypothetical protein